MNIEKTIQDNHEAQLVVEFEQEKMETYKRRAARKIAEGGKIPGFRPGKAPYEVVVRNFGEQAILEQAMDFLIDEEYSNILDQADIKPGAPGMLKSIDSLEPPKLTFFVPLAPEVDLGDYRSIRHPYEWTPPTESEVDEALERLRQGYAATETVEREIIKGDFVLLDIKSETVELNRAGFAIVIRDEEGLNEWPYSGFSKELIGLKPQDSKTIEHTFPEDWEVEALRGKNVQIEITIKVVRSMTLPDLDDAFAKMTNAGETLADLREAVTKDLVARSQAEYDDKYFPELLDKVREGATLKYHQREIEHETEHVMEDLEHRVSRQNLDLEAFFKLRETTREKYLEEEVKPAAKKRLERSLIIDEIVRIEKIKPREDELNSEFENTFQSLAQRGFDLTKIQGGKKGQQRVVQNIALESASRVMTRHALNILKSIAIGEYKPFVEETVEAEAQTEFTETEAKPEQTESE